MVRTAGHVCAGTPLVFKQKRQWTLLECATSQAAVSPMFWEADTCQVRYRVKQHVIRVSPARIRFHSCDDFRLSLFVGLAEPHQRWNMQLAGQCSAGAVATPVASDQKCLSVVTGKGQRGGPARSFQPLHNLL